MEVLVITILKALQEFDPLAVLEAGMNKECLRALVGAAGASAVEAAAQATLRLMEVLEVPADHRAVPVLSPAVLADQRVLAAQRTL